jgi:hypothetical protein
VDPRYSVACGGIAHRLRHQKLFFIVVCSGTLVCPDVNFQNQLEFMLIPLCQQRKFKGEERVALTRLLFLGSVSVSSISICTFVLPLFVDNWSNQSSQRTECGHNNNKKKSVLRSLESIPHCSPKFRFQQRIVVPISDKSNELT